MLFFFIFGHNQLFQSKSDLINWMISISPKCLCSALVQPNPRLLHNTNTVRPGCKLEPVLVLTKCRLVVCQN